MSKAVCMNTDYRHAAYHVNTGNPPFASEIIGGQNARMPKRLPRPGTLPDKFEVGRRLLAMRQALGMRKVADGRPAGVRPDDLGQV